jgi:hypothetical protein
LTATATVLTLLLAPVAADAATRYASPGGTGPVATCPQTNPCTATDALDAGNVNNGDVIRFFGGSGGSYDTAFGFDVFDQVTVEPEPGTGTPRLTSGGTTLLIATTAAGSTVRGLEIVSNSPGPADVVHINPGGASTLERLKLIATNGANLGVQLEGTLRDSVVLMQGATGGFGVLPCCNGASLRNVTAIGTSTNSVGVGILTGYIASGTVTARNVIARGPGHGIQLRDDDAPGDDNVTLDLAFSNFSSADDDASPDTTLLLGAGNQTGAPLFVNQATGDLRQLPGSSTIDRGLSDGLVGPLDFDGQPRIQGPAVDIGADEATDPASLLALSSAGKLPRKKTLTISASCPLVKCNVAAAANLVVKGAAKPAVASKIFKLENVTASLTAGEQGLLTFKLSKKALKKLRGATKATLNVSAAATDPLGFSGTESLSLKFKKPPKRKK